MFRKKMLLAGAAVILTFSLSVFPAFAHGHGGHHGGHHGNWTTQNIPGNNDNTGAAAPNTDADTGTAAVSGAYPVCPFEGCAETGHHLHDGSYYCGYHHNSGYCDGSCVGSAPAFSNPPAADDSSAASNAPSANSYNYGRRYGCHRSYARKMVYCH